MSGNCIQWSTLNILTFFPKLKYILWRQKSPKSPKMRRFFLPFTLSWVLHENEPTYAISLNHSRRDLISQQIKRFGILVSDFPKCSTPRKPSWKQFEEHFGCRAAARAMWRAGLQGYSRSCCCNLNAVFDLLCQIECNINTLLLNWWLLKCCWMMNQLSSCRKGLKSHIELIYEEIAVYLLSVQFISYF